MGRAKLQGAHPVLAGPRASSWRRLRRRPAPALTFQCSIT